MIFKTIFDYVLAVILLVLLGWIIILLLIISLLDTKKWGFYTQQRIGKNGKSFKIFKIRTMIEHKKNKGHTTLESNKYTTRIGVKLRKYKLDELPQLINILQGNMSFVGPRPDVKGYADQLNEEDRIILSMKPGITSDATLKYRNEEALLNIVSNPKRYNDQIIWPDKVKMNKSYVKNWSFKNDIHILYKTGITTFFSSK